MHISYDNIHDDNKSTNAEAEQKTLKDDETAGKQHNQYESQSMSDIETSDKQPQYEYVSLGKAVSDCVKRALSKIAPISTAITCILIAIVCVLVMRLLSSSSDALIIVGFVVISGLLATIVCSAWLERKKANEEYELALSLIEPVKDKMRSEDDGDGKKKS